MADPGAPEGDRVAFGGVNPILRVRSLAASVDYFVRALGFAIDWEDSGVIASVSRDRVCLFLCEGDQGTPGTWVWVGVGDAGALHEEYLRSGARVRHPPTNYGWAYEMQVEDLDGNVLRLGSDPLPDRPFGEWLDMRGGRWAPTPDGGWRRVASPAAPGSGAGEGGPA